MSSKVVYQCDAAGVYIGESLAFESPLEPGVYPLPAGCVDIAPPDIAAGQAAVLVDGVWQVVPDHRGETWYLDGVAMVITSVGDPTDDGYAAEPPPPSLEEQRASKITAIVEASAALLAAGAPVDGGQHIALDDGSRADLTAMAATATAAIGGAVPWPDSYARGWIAIENIRLPLAAPADGLTLAATVGAYYAAIVQHRRDLKDAALEAADEPALDAIDVSAGWPNGS